MPELKKKQINYKSVFYKNTQSQNIDTQKNTLIQFKALARHPAFKPVFRTKPLKRPLLMKAAALKEIE